MLGLHWGTIPWRRIRAQIQQRTPRGLVVTCAVGRGRAEAPVWRCGWQPRTRPAAWAGPGPVALRRRSLPKGRRRQNAARHRQRPALRLSLARNQRTPNKRRAISVHGAHYSTSALYWMLESWPTMGVTNRSSSSLSRQLLPLVAFPVRCIRSELRDRHVRQLASQHSAHGYYMHN